MARRISGRVLTFDVEPEMIRRTRERVERAGLHNVTDRQRDVLAVGYGLPEASLDGCLLFNILHCEHPGPLLRASSQPVRPGG
ncbi:MAG TPA: class I SAM-dependent methyltransferase [Phycisphaerae bacterium]|nr:class I SAM-dependent methyltransferase [Phycisphaerae bacterium]HPU32043.1 class I SAM-dependent methyltransferase [Phycisphaerae bacterium]HQA46729.1 class I SAM-dependent methyltransferase [Phycisphaerae bacterium]